MIEDIHCEGSLILFALAIPVAAAAAGGGGGMLCRSRRGVRPEWHGRHAKGSRQSIGRNSGSGGRRQACRAAVMRHRLHKSVEDIVKEAKEAEDKGYDVYQMRSHQP